MSVYRNWIFNIESRTCLRENIPQQKMKQVQNLNSVFTEKFVNKYLNISHFDLEREQKIRSYQNQVGKLNLLNVQNQKTKTLNLKINDDTQCDFSSNHPFDSRPISPRQYLTHDPNTKQEILTTTLPKHNNINSSFFLLLKSHYDQNKQPLNRQNTKPSNPETPSFFKDNQNEFFVRIVYDDHILKLDFCGKQEFCPIDRFLEFLHNNTYYYVRTFLDELKLIPDDKFKSIC